MFLFIIISALLITKLSVEPLKEHIDNLKNLSIETLHELNLPLSTIKTNLQMLQKTIKDEKSSKRISRINVACDMLQQRYDELDYMIKKQSIREIKESFDISLIIKERVKFLHSLYPTFMFNLELKTTYIDNDKIGLSKVIDNIIDNGVKYSQNNKTIDIKLYDQELSITDYGKGMDEVELIQIYDNYYQTNRSVQGFGIGLSMIKRFCDNNNIWLNISSKPNIGTTIKLKFKQKKF